MFTHTTAQVRKTVQHLGSNVDRNFISSPLEPKETAVQTRVELLDGLLVATRHLGTTLAEDLACVNAV
jgi:hypothetical protein